MNFKSSIQQSSSILTIQNSINKVIGTFHTNEILIVYDIDRTITQPSHPAYYISNRTKYKNLYEQSLKDLNTEQRDVLANLSILHSPWELVEAEFPGVIAYYRDHLQIKSIALTASLTGALAQVERLEEWRYEELKKFNIDFSVSFPNHKFVEFKDAPSYLGRKPMYYKGILLSNGERSIFTKGDLLVKFLEVANYQPKLIIVIDDKLHFLEKIQRSFSLTDHNPQCLGSEYTASAENFLAEISEDDIFNYWSNLATLSKKHNLF